MRAPALRFQPAHFEAYAYKNGRALRRRIKIHGPGPGKVLGVESSARKKESAVVSENDMQWRHRRLPRGKHVRCVHTPAQAQEKGGEDRENSTERTLYRDTCSENTKARRREVERRRRRRSCTYLLWIPTSAVRLRPLPCGTVRRRGHRVGHLYRLCCSSRILRGRG